VFKICDQVAPISDNYLFRCGSSLKAVIHLRPELSGGDLRFQDGTIPAPLPLAGQENAVTEVESSIRSSLAAVREAGAPLWRGHSSVLVVGSLGTGKSSVIKLLQCRLRSEVNCCEVFVSLNDSVSSSSSLHGGWSRAAIDRDGEHSGGGSKFADGRNSGWADIMGAVIGLLDSIAEVASVSVRNERLLSGWRKLYESRYRGGPLSTPVEPCLLLLLIDDLDSLLVRGLVDGSQEASAALVSLRLLLAAVSRRRAPAQERFDIMIVGTAKSVEQPCFRTLIGPPGFDIVRYINNPTECDRVQLIERFLKARRTGLEPTDDFAGAETADTDILSVSSRLAKLTPGYAPGDVSKVLSRAQLFADAESPDRSAAAVPPAWTHILLALAATAPVTLRTAIDKIGLGGDGNTTQENGERLRWEHFGGHDDMKRRLKLLLQRLDRQDSSPPDITLKAKSIFDSFDDKPKGIILAGPPGCGASVPFNSCIDRF
jgi:hypothetical protein